MNYYRTPRMLLLPLVCALHCSLKCVIATLNKNGSNQKAVRVYNCARYQQLHSKVQSINKAVSCLVPDEYAFMLSEQNIGIYSEGEKLGSFSYIVLFNVNDDGPDYEQSWLITYKGNNAQIQSFLDWIKKRSNLQPLSDEIERMALRRQQASRRKVRRKR